MSSRSRYPRSTTLKRVEAESSTPQNSVVSSMVIVEKDKIVKASLEKKAKPGTWTE